MNPIASTISVLVAVGGMLSVTAAHQDDIVTGTATTTSMVNMTLCHDMCHWDCQSYVTPLDACFSSGRLFPNDPSWGDGWDILDTIVLDQAMLHRIIYSSQDGTCTGTDPDSFDIPLNECVGPFGAPRPWGTFELLPGNATTSAVH
jgi:hypothetical protein